MEFLRVLSIFLLGGCWAVGASLLAETHGWSNGQKWALILFGVIAIGLLL